MKAARNTFLKGLKNEKDPLSVDKDEYVDALNIRIESDEGGSSYSVINIKGNRHDTTIPEVPALVSITPNFDYVLVFLTTEVIPTIVIDGNTITGAPVYADERSYLVLFKALENAFKTDPAFTPYNLKVARQGLRLVITSHTNVVSAAPSTSVINQEDISGMTSASQHIIGWETSDQAFYILTTNDHSTNGGSGAVWKLTYDPIDYTYSWDLRYSSPDIKFTTKYPVANPSGIEISEETDEIVRLAWTDNFNPLRFLNVQSPNSLALTVGMLDIHDGQTSSIPIFKDILNGGSLKNGAYQVAYRLRAKDAGYSLLSQHSKVINITEDSEHTDNQKPQDYEGSDSDQDQDASKSIRFQFKIPETAFSFVEIFTLYRSSITDVPEVRLVTEIPIYNNKIDYTISGSEEAATFTYEEFQNLYTPFTHCKTIAQKDNILFAGNVRSDDFDVEFDPRAYGHNSLGDSYISNSLYTYPSDTELDAINPNFDSYKYKENGITYGGTGPNVSYEFTKRFHFGDVSPYGSNGGYIEESGELPTSLTTQRFLYSWNPDQPNLIDNIYLTDSTGGQDTYAGMVQGHMSPWESANFRGYKRGEIYRFAFVPIKNGQEGRAKWIADIKIPHYVDAPDESVDYWWDDYKICRRDQGGDITQQGARLNTIGIKFDIDVSSIASEIDGYKIKRVKRTDADKTILGSGLLGMTANRYNADYPGTYLDGNVQIKDGSGLGDKNPFRNTDSRPRSSIESAQGGRGNRGSNYAFYSPDMCFKDSFQHKGGDEFRIHALVHPIIPDAATQDTGIDSWSSTGNNSNTTITKLYEQVNIKGILDNMDPNDLPQHLSSNDVENGFIKLKVSDASICEYGASVDLNGRQPFHNRSHLGNDDVGTPNTIGVYQRHLGTKCLAMASQKTAFIDRLLRYSDDPVLTSRFDNRTATQVRRYGDYYRPLANQYGGNTYSARTKNVYIDTGTYVEVSSSTTNTSVNVFGGDTYINIMDITTLTRNIAGWLDTRDALEDEFPNNITDETKKNFNYIEYFPVESGINTDLRQGNYFQKSFTDMTGAGIKLQGHAFGDGVPSNTEPNWSAEDWEGYLLSDIQRSGEDFIYNFAYSAEEDLQPSFPEPLTGEETDKFPVRIYASDLKTSGELINSWRRFRTQSYIDINGKYGPINAMVNNLDKVIALQEDAFGIASVNERQVAQTQSAEATILGSSGVLPRFDYISVFSGTRHQFGLVLSPNSLYFYDVADAVLYRFNGQNVTPISQVGELNQFFYNNFRGELIVNDNPIYDSDSNLATYNPIGITGTYDYRFNEALFTFHNKLSDGKSGYISKTLAFNENATTFTSFYSPTPTVYLNDRDNVFSPAPPAGQLDSSGPQSKIYIHNKGDRGKFYDNPEEDSYVEVVVSAEAANSKVFTNLEWASEVYDSSGNNTYDQTVDSITISNAYQTLPSLTTYQRRFRTWRATIPRELTTRARLRGHYMKMRYTFNNSNNRKFVLSGITTIYDTVAY